MNRIIITGTAPCVLAPRHDPAQNGRIGTRPAETVFRAVLALSVLQTAAPLLAATLVVGPNEPLSRISDAARIATDGDTVLILPGEYRGDVAVWTQKSLTIRAAGDRPILVADGEIAEGKAIWVIRDGDFLIENIEFRGARAPAGNGAGIRFERGRLEVRDSVFVDNQNGILTANFADSELIVRNTLFADAPRPNQSLPHLLYVGKIARFELTGSHFRNGFEGHLVKSRARQNEIRYNLIYDGPDGGASYELEFPNGGVARIVGNVIGQSEATQNPIVISYGAEGQVWAENRLQLAHNTLVSDGLRAARFLQVWDQWFADGVEVEAFNNLTVGLGAFTLGTTGRFSGNFPLPPGLLDSDLLDFTLGPRSMLRGRVSAIDSQDPLRPTSEFTLPAGTIPLVPPAEWAPGAFQSHGTTR